MIVKKYKVYSLPSNRDTDVNTKLRYNSGNINKQCNVAIYSKLNITEPIWWLYRLDNPNKYIIIPKRCYIRYVLVHEDPIPRGTLDIVLKINNQIVLGHDRNVNTGSATLEALIEVPGNSKCYIYNGYSLGHHLYYGWNNKAIYVELVNNPNTTGYTPITRIGGYYSIGVTWIPGCYANGYKCYTKTYSYQQGLIEKEKIMKVKSTKLTIY